MPFTVTTALTKPPISREGGDAAVLAVKTVQDGVSVSTKKASQEPNEKSRFVLFIDSLYKIWQNLPALAVNGRFGKGIIIGHL